MFGERLLKPSRQNSTSIMIESAKQTLNVRLLGDIVQVTREVCGRGSRHE